MPEKKTYFVTVHMKKLEEHSLEHEIEIEAESLEEAEEIADNLCPMKLEEDEELYANWVYEYLYDQVIESVRVEEDER